MANVQQDARQAPKRRDPLFALLIGNAVWGAALGLAFAAGTIALDIGHLRSLIGFNSDGLIAVILLVMGSVVTFASVAMGGAIMLIESDDKPDRGHRVLRRLTPALARQVARPRQTDAQTRR